MPKKFILIIILVILGGCSKPPALQKFTKTGEFFSSVVKIDVCYSPQQKNALDAAVDQIWRRFADIHWRLSVYDPESDLNRINSSYPNPVAVGADTYGLIADAIFYHQLSDGLFDISIYPLLKAWKAGEKRNVLPTAEEIQIAQAAMGVNKIKLLERNQVQLLDPSVKINIDSIADGFAGDEAVQILKAYGFSDFLVDTTGELYGAGNNCEGKPWRIGVRDPFNPSNILDVVSVNNLAVTTSGNYEHFYTIDGKDYSHIINPKTGFPNEKLVSATVIAPSAEISDFLSTALCLLEPERGIELIDRMGEHYASMVVVDQASGITIKKSKNYDRYLTE